MDRKRYEQIHQIFDQARTLSGAARERLLDEACAEDAELRAEVETLLQYDSGGLAAEDLASVSPGEQPGDLVGRYKLLQQIGEGGFGTVWMAEQREPVQRRVALKLIKLGMDTKQVIARFDAERQALAMMEHPAIASVFDAGATESGRPYFVMELVRGSPITEYCDRKKVPIRERLELIVQVCEALEHAHQKGVIHRDIKPSNVLVTSVGDRPMPKIIDFGIAKATTRRLTEKTLFTEFRQMIGTPEYMSPEQATEDAEDADTRTDVYSTGVLLYELITGVTPFDSARLRSAEYGELRRIIREDDPPMPSTRVSENAHSLAHVAEHRQADPTKLGLMIRGELDWIVMKALEKDRSRRYDSAGSMMRDVRRYLDGHAIEAAPPSKVYRARKFVRRHRGTVGTVALLLLALLGGLVGTTLGFLDARAERKESNRQRDIARDERKRADGKAAKALASAALARRSAYSANMLSASQAFEASRHVQLQSFLEDAPSALRGWEWRVLHSRLDESIRRLVGTATKGPPLSGLGKMLLHPNGQSFFTVRREERVVAQQWNLGTGQIEAEFAHPSGASESRGRAEVLVSADQTMLLAAAITQGENPIHVTAWSLVDGQKVRHVDVAPNPELVASLAPATRQTALKGAVRPDGKFVVLMLGRTIWVQDLATGSVVQRSELQIDPARCSFNHDGSKLAVCDGRGGLQLLDGRTLQATTLEGHRNLIASFDFTRDGRWLATSSLDSTVRVWDLEASPPTSVVCKHPHSVDSVRFLDGAKSVVTAGGDRVLRVFDAHTGEVTVSVQESAASLDTLMSLPDGQTFAVRLLDGTTCFWDATAAATVRLQGHRGQTNGAAFAASPGLIVSVGWDGWSGVPGCVRLWDAETGDLVVAFGRAGEIARGLTVSADGRFAAVMISPRKTPREPAVPPRNGGMIVDLTTGSQVQWKGMSLSMAFDPTATMLAMGSYGELIVRNMDGRAIRSRKDLGTDLVQEVAWSADGSLIRCSLTDGDGKRRTELMDSATLQTVRTLDSSLHFFPDGKRVLTGSANEELQVRAIDTWEVLETIAAYRPGRASMQFSPDGSRFATRAGEVVVWDAKTFDRVGSFHESGYVASIAWSADSQRLVAAWGNTICVWDDVPLRDRVAARTATRVALETVRPLVERLSAELRTPELVLERIRADASLTATQRKVARHEVLRRALSGQ